MKIYCDLDGVITNCNGKLEELGIVTLANFWNWLKTHNAIQIQEFWESLEFLPGAEEFWYSLPHNEYPINILSSYAMDIPYIKKGGQTGKTNWVTANLYPQPTEILIEKQKHLYAGEDCILIDDTQKKIDKWHQSGGIGILHTSYENTLEELYGYLDV